MRIEVIACNCCRTILGEPVEFEMPTIDPRDVYDADNQELEVEFADGWMLYAFPSLGDPVGITTRHRCPDCV